MDEDMMREAADDKLINDAFGRLLDSYLASRHRKKVDIITKAFNFARQAHKGVRRLSGEPYIMHPIAVAQIADAGIEAEIGCVGRPPCRFQGLCTGRHSCPCGLELRVAAVGGGKHLVKRDNHTLGGCSDRKKSCN